MSTFPDGAKMAMIDLDYGKAGAPGKPHGHPWHWNWQLTLLSLLIAMKR